MYFRVLQLVRVSAPLRPLHSTHKPTSGGGHRGDGAAADTRPRRRSRRSLLQRRRALPVPRAAAGSPQRQAAATRRAAPSRPGLGLGSNLSNLYFFVPLLKDIFTMSRVCGSKKPFFSQIFLLQHKHLTSVYRYL